MQLLRRPGVEPRHPAYETGNLPLIYLAIILIIIYLYTSALFRADSALFRAE
jgi:hypothetical protein